MLSRPKRRRWDAVTGIGSSLHRRKGKTEDLSARLDSFRTACTQLHPSLNPLIESVDVLRQTAQSSTHSGAFKLFKRSFKILEVLVDRVNSNPTSISPAMFQQIKDLTELFSEIHLSLSPSYTGPFSLDDLKAQLGIAYSEFVCKLKPPCSPIREALRHAGDASTTVLQVVNQAADVFPPLKSASGGALALLDMSKRAGSSTARAQQLQCDITEMVDVCRGTDSYSHLDGLCSKVPELQELSRQSTISRHTHLNRNEELLATSQAEIDRTFRKMLLRQSTTIMHHVDENTILLDAYRQKLNLLEQQLQVNNKLQKTHNDQLSFIIRATRIVFL